MLGLLQHLPASALVPAGAEDGKGIQQLAFLVGGVWVARADGQVTEERCAWWLDETVIATDVTSLQGGKVAATARGMFVWDPVQSVLVSSAASSVGMVVLSVQTGGSESPPTWIFDARYRGAVDQRRRITMSHPSDDELVIAQALRKEDGTYEPLGSVTYHRESR